MARPKKELFTVYYTIEGSTGFETVDSLKAVEKFLANEQMELEDVAVGLGAPLSLAHGGLQIVTEKKPRKSRAPKSKTSAPTTYAGARDGDKPKLNKDGSLRKKRGPNKPKPLTVKGPDGKDLVLGADGETIPSVVTKHANGEGERV